MSNLISFSRYQTKCVITFLFRQLMTLETIKIYKIINIIKIYLASSSQAMADREKKSGKCKQKNLNISRTKRAF